MEIPLIKPPTIPPFGFFEPISVEPSEQFSRTEFLFGLLKRLNVVIVEVNKLSKDVAGYDERLEKLETEMSSIRTDLARTLAEFRTQIESELETNLTLSKAYTDYIKGLLDAEIADIVAGQINVYDPTTGQLSPIQTVINNIYDSGRLEALTATEYDALDLSATEYDAEELTAYQYDNQGKTLLGGE